MKSDEAISTHARGSLRTLTGASLATTQIVRFL
jgi:hypothetical protein